uniref:Uncharacterized protein n=1 Tax=Panagrolaimus sp. PS1159 TaxID=55785 RepID=A0AC35FG13_9BILA
MLVFFSWGNGDILTKAKYVGISGFITSAFTTMFAFWLFFWFYCPISAAQAIAYLLVFVGIFKHEPRFLLYSKCLLALTLVANLLLGIACFFFYAFVFGIYFFMFGFIFFIGIGFTGFAVFIIHRAHKTMEGTGCDHSQAPPPLPRHGFYPPPPTGNGVNPSDPRY